MTIHVNIGEAKTRLSELVSAALRGEEVVIAKAGSPQVRLAPVAVDSPSSIAERRAKRLSAIGMFKHLVGDREIEIGPSMTDEEWEERYQRKFGPAA